jgi:hypothetical protein
MQFMILVFFIHLSKAIKGVKLWDGCVTAIQCRVQTEHAYPGNNLFSLVCAILILFVSLSSNFMPLLWFTTITKNELTTRNLEPYQWRNREEWHLVSGRRWQLLLNRINRLEMNGTRSGMPLVLAGAVLNHLTPFHCRIQNNNQN